MTAITRNDGPTDENFPNRERGFPAVRDPDSPKDDNAPPLTKAEMDALRRDDFRSVICEGYILDGFRTRDLSQAFLNTV